MIRIENYKIEFFQKRIYNFILHAKCLFQIVQNLDQMTNEN